MSSDSQNDLSEGQQTEVQTTEVQHTEAQHTEVQSTEVQTTEVQHQEGVSGATAGAPAVETEEHQSVSAGQHELHASGLGNAVLSGDSADDHLYGGQHDDVLDGNDGNDSLDGGGGNDILIAGGQTDHGANSVDGGAGDDVLIAGGAQTLQLHDFLQSHPEVGDLVRTDARFAGALSLVDATPTGADAAATNVFAFHAENGHDAIYNFHALTDKIQIDRGVNGSDITDIDSLVRHINVSGNDMSIDLGHGNSVTLVGVDVAHLSADNVLWA